MINEDPTFLSPAEANEQFFFLDIHSNVRFSPRLCPWTIDRKLEETSELFLE